MSEIQALAYFKITIHVPKMVDAEPLYNALGNSTFWNNPQKILANAIIVYTMCSVGYL